MLETNNRTSEVLPKETVNSLFPTEAYDFGSTKMDPTVNPFLGFNAAAGFNNNSSDINNPEKLMRTIILAKGGDYNHQFRLARYFHEINRRDFALNWFRRAAEQGHADSQFYLAFMFYTGDGIHKNKQEAAAWCLKAAEQGLAAAQFGLASMLEDDDKKVLAATWYRKAAKQGFVRAQYNLANTLISGDGIGKNIEEAIKWYRMAAEQGHAGAQHNLATCFGNGEGVKQNQFNALVLFSMAVNNGATVAAREKDNAKNFFTPEQIEEAEQLAKAWKVGTPLPLEE